MSETGEITPQTTIEPDFAGRALKALGERLLSTPETSRYLHATNRDNAKSILKEGLLMDRRMGFSGVAIPLGTKDEARSLRELRFTHRDLPVVIFVASPNIRKEMSNMVQQGLLPADFRQETLFTTREAKKEQLTQYHKTDVFFDRQFIEGFYDKSTNEWVDNPQYWENVLKQKQAASHWNRGEYQKRRQEAFQKYREEALSRLEKISQEYQAQKEGPSEEWWLKGEGDEESEIRTP